jgi:putative transposase
MKKEIRKKQIEKMIFCSIENLFRNQDSLSLDEFAVATIEGLMLLEREEYLKSRDGEGDKGNGAYTRTFKSLRRNSLQIQIPRTRNGKFKPLVLNIVNQQKEDLNELALLLYRKGLSSRDVSDIMEEYFSESMSKDTVNKLAESFHEIRKNWEKRQLDAYYKAVYCDALYVSLKRNNSYSKEAVYVIYGVKDDNTRELLLLEVNPTEGSSMWGEYFKQLKSRGVEQIDLIIADGLVGFADAAKQYYPDSDVQRCVVHLQRNLMNKVRPRDKEAFAHDLKLAFNNFDKDSSKDNAMNKIKEFVSNWKDSYSTVNRLLDEEFILDYLTYIDYPLGVRRMIYTTNSIENLNRQIRKVTKTKVTFDKESNLLDLVFMVIKDFEAHNWQKYPVNPFSNWPKKHNI